LTESTNRLLFAIVILLFAFILKLLTSSIDLLVFIIAFAGLAIAFYLCHHSARTTLVLGRMQ
jgi:hypothetical protein